MTPKLKVFLGAWVPSLALDQVSKAWVSSSISYADQITVIDGFFYLTYVRNPGAAFSLFAESPEAFRKFFFVGVALVAIVLIFSFYRQLAPGDRLSALALGLVLGGASGNLIDRVFRSFEVVDFLRFELWRGYSWPDFNFADSFIVVGVLLLVLELLAAESESRADGDPPGTDAVES
jgi:signal peptidase II